MLRSISSVQAKSCIILLLWAHVLRVAIARQVVVDDSETDKIIYSDRAWDAYPGCLKCGQAPHLVLGYVHNGTWHKNNDGNLGFSFKFYGNAVEVRFIAICPSSSSMPVHYSIDNIEKSVVAMRQGCSRPGYLYNQTLFSVQRLSNEEHTLRVASPVSFMFDYLVYETEDVDTGLDWAQTIIEIPGVTIAGISTSEEMTGTRYGTPADTSTATSFSTSLNPTSSNLEMTQASSASRSQGAIIGGAVSAVVLLVFGITLFLFLKRRRRARLSETIAPYVEDTSFGVSTPGLRNFTGRPKRYSLNTTTSVANQPVEAGLMSLEVNDPT